MRTRLRADGHFSRLRRRCSARVVAGVLGALLLSACDRSADQGSAREQRHAAATPDVEAALPVPEGWETWSQAEALAAMHAPEHAVAAAIRLVRLAEATPLCVPDTLTPAALEPLTVLPAGVSGWALGYESRATPYELQAPVLLSGTGEVALVGDGVDEELALFRLPKEDEAFPQVVVSPSVVWVLEEHAQPAIVLAAPIGTLRFAVRMSDEAPYIALLGPGDGEEVEIAQYTWSLYELSFFGPGSDVLPAPLVGRFELDLDASLRLEPVGGTLPEPRENTEPTIPEGGPYEIRTTSGTRLVTPAILEL